MIRFVFAGVALGLATSAGMSVAPAKFMGGGW
jgi:hypothetical protein